MSIYISDKAKWTKETGQWHLDTSWTVISLNSRLSLALSTGWCIERLCWNIIILQRRIMSPWLAKIVKCQWSGARLKKVERSSSDLRKSNRAILWKGCEQNEESWQTTCLTENYCNVFWLSVKLGKGPYTLQKLEVLCQVLKCEVCEYVSVCVCVREQSWLCLFVFWTIISLCFCDVYAS